jgi:hypothetical protein
MPGNRNKIVYPGPGSVRSVIGEFGNIPALLLSSIAHSVVSVRAPVNFSASEIFIDH